MMKSNTSSACRRTCEPSAPIGLITKQRRRIVTSTLTSRRTRYELLAVLLRRTNQCGAPHPSPHHSCCHRTSIRATGAGCPIGPQAAIGAAARPCRARAPLLGISARPYSFSCHTTRILRPVKKKSAPTIHPLPRLPCGVYTFPLRTTTLLPERRPRKTSPGTSAARPAVRRPCSTAWPTPRTGDGQQPAPPGRRRRPPLPRPAPAPPARPPYARRTEDGYVGWASRFFLFHGRRHPVDLGAPHVEESHMHLGPRSRRA
jgi:hypothetical protein